MAHYVLELQSCRTVEDPADVLTAQSLSGSCVEDRPNGELRYGVYREAPRYFSKVANMAIEPEDRSFDYRCTTSMASSAYGASCTR
jgi:hypothetical protein